MQEAEGHGGCCWCATTKLKGEAEDWKPPQNPHQKVWSARVGPLARTSAMSQRRRIPKHNIKGKMTKVNKAAVKQKFLFVTIGYSRQKRR